MDTMTSTRAPSRSALTSTWQPCSERQTVACLFATTQGRRTRDIRVLDKHVVVLRRERTINVARLNVNLQHALHLAFVVAHVDCILELDHVPAVEQWWSQPVSEAKQQCSRATEMQNICYDAYERDDRYTLATPTNTVKYYLVLENRIFPLLVL